MPAKKDYYDVLGIDRNASADQIRSAYRAKARKLHPDVNKASDAQERFAELQEAYDVLSDEQKKTAYDRFGHAAVDAGASGGGWGGGQGQWSGQAGGAQGFGDFGDIFEQIFSGGGGGASPFGGRGGPRAQPHRPRPKKGANRQLDLKVELLDAARGGTVPFRISGPDGVETVDVKIPAGIESGSKLRVKSKGNAGAHGGPAGDLILTIQVKPHPWLTRSGAALQMNLPITIAEATLGATVAVPLPFAEGTIDLRIPPGTSSGKKLRVKGKGIKNGRGEGQDGDFDLIIQIIAPDELSEAGSKAMEQLAAELKNPRDMAPWADT